MRKASLARILVLVALGVGSLILASCDWLVPQSRANLDGTNPRLLYDVTADTISLGP